MVSKLFKKVADVSAVQSTRAMVDSMNAAFAWMQPLSLQLDADVLHPKKSRNEHIDNLLRAESIVALRQSDLDRFDEVNGF